MEQSTKSQNPQHQPSNHEMEDFFDFLRFDSVSTDPARHSRCRDCAAWVAEHMRKSGLKSEICETDGLPVVIAKNEHRSDRPTVLVYGHYDVQPEDPVDLWQHPPFEPTINNGVVYARGATDNKGQIFSHMLGARRMLAESGDLPLNVIYLVEGEEEIGSPSIGPFLRANLAELRCNAVIASDTAMLAPDLPTLTYGLRGIAALEIRLTGPARDLHSGIFGGAVMNPLLALSRLIASLHDEHRRVTVPGFYDDLRQLTPAERAAWAKLPLNEEQILALTGATTTWGEEGYTPLERMWARPTAEVNGLYGGYQGPGTKTIIPSQAVAKLTFRLVPHQIPERLLESVINFLRSQCPPECKLEIIPGHTGEPYFLDPLGPLGKLAVDALRAAGGDPHKEPALICEGGTVPIISQFKNILGADSILVGMALPDCRIHSPNENFPLALLDYGARLHRELLTRLASLR